MSNIRRQPVTKRSYLLGYVLLVILFTLADVSVRASEHVSKSDKSPERSAKVEALTKSEAPKPGPTGTTLHSAKPDNTASKNLSTAAEKSPTPQTTKKSAAVQPTAIPSKPESSPVKPTAIPSKPESSPVKPTAIPSKPESSPVKPAPASLSGAEKKPPTPLPGTTPFGAPPFIPSSVPPSHDIRVERAVTFWVLDGDGNWKIPLPNWTIEDILGSIDTRKDEDKELPYTIQSVNVDGRVEGNIARLKVEFRISTTNASMVRVPLGLKEGVCILDEGKEDIYDAIGYVGLGNYAIEYDEKANGYVAIIQNRPGANKSALKPSRSDDPALNRTGSGTSGVNDPKPGLTSPSSGAPLETDRNRLGSRAPFGRLRSGFSLHTLTMTLCFPVKKQGKEEFSLSATFPPAVHAKLRLIVPQSDVQVRVNQGAIAMPPTNLDSATSEIVLGGLNRSWEPSEVFWYKKDRPIAEEQAILQIEEAEIDALPGVQDIQYSVKLPIRTYGGSSDSFRIRLPDQARLVRDSVVATGLTGNVLEIQDIKEIKLEQTRPVAPVPGVSSDKPSDTKPSDPKGQTGTKPKPLLTGTSPASDTPLPSGSARHDGQVVEISLSRKIRDTVVIQFKAVAENALTRNAPADGKGSASCDWELGGFEVIGAQKQHGRVKIQFPEGLNFKVTPAYGVRPVLEESLEADDQTEQYRFFTQPFSLKAQVVVRQTRIKVKPEYQISVGQGQIELRALFQYSVHGSKIKQLSFQFGDWIINEIKSNYIVDVDKIYTEPVSREVILPLTAASEGFIEVELVAVRDLNRKGDVLEFPLPLPIADWVDPGAIVVVPDDNIELIPLSERMQRLRPRSRRSFSLYFEIPSRQQPPLMFQAESIDSRNKAGRADQGKFPVFAAAIKFHTRKVRIQSQTDVLLTGKEGEQIQQTLLYNVAYEPLEAVTFLVPRDLQDPAAIKITVQGKPILPQKIVTESSDNPQAKMVRKKIFLSEEPLIGNCIVVLRYTYKNIELVPKMSNKITLNLVRPDDGTLTEGRISINTPPGITLEHDASEKDGWKAEENSPVAKGDLVSWLFTSQENTDTIILRGVVEARDVLGTTVVERAWLQTWLVGTTRLDRASWKIVSDQPSVLIELPRQFRQDRVSVKFNNVPYLGTAPTGSETVKQRLFDRLERLVIQIPEELRLKPFTLEVFYMIDMPQYDIRYLREIDFPRFVGSSVWVRRSYWQVILPTEKHLIGDIANWTPEYYNGFTWSGLFWSRVASMDQDELSGWIGISRREKIPADTNVYLFSSFNQPDSSFLYVADRGILILTGSGVTLIMGLCLIYFPMFRHRGIMMFLAVAFVGICCWRPTITLLFLQTTVLGVVLTIVALFLAKIFRSAGESAAGQDRRHGYSGSAKSHDTKISRTSSSLWLEDKSASGAAP